MKLLPASIGSTGRRVGRVSGNNSLKTGICLSTREEGAHGMAVEHNTALRPVSRLIVQGLAMVENVVYLGLGTLLAVSALALLWYGFRTLLRALVARSLGGEIVGLLDQILLVLLVVELLYTVQVSVREHGLLAEPFLVVALIAVIRRILVLTAEFHRLPQADDTVFRHAIVELGLLTVMVVALVGSLIVLQRRLSTPA